MKKPVWVQFISHGDVDCHCVIDRFSIHIQFMFFIQSSANPMTKRSQGASDQGKKGKK
jgi:hypothetical protein